MAFRHNAAMMSFFTCRRMRM